MLIVYEPNRLFIQVKILDVWHFFLDKNDNKLPKIGYMIKQISYWFKQ